LPHNWTAEITLFIETTTLFIETTMTTRRSSLMCVLMPVVLVSVACSTLDAQDTPAVLKACFVPSTGTIYRVAAAGTPTVCTKATHVLFEWNQIGPKGEPGVAGAAGTTGTAGPTGPTGATGPAGPPGATGPAGAAGAAGATGAQGPAGSQGATGVNGVSGYEIITETITWPSYPTLPCCGLARWPVPLGVTCPVGKRVLTGGLVLPDGAIPALNASKGAASFNFGTADVPSGSPYLSPDGRTWGLYGLSTDGVPPMTAKIQVACISTQ
jgi:hypothetical protein